MTAHSAPMDQVLPEALQEVAPAAVPEILPGMLPTGEMFPQFLDPNNPQQLLDPNNPQLLVANAPTLPIMSNPAHAALANETISAGEHTYPTYS